ncbi:MAG TPA: lysozyme inhibitor LprI family protein [Gemmatimonadaceae bacterium]|nr:lysozyme inhibitor LprI family protein [Gemmatimonadaceae bacterium]
MQNTSGEPSPNLGGLESTYQILTELQATPGADTYLARHLTLNRDVTITVFRAAAADRAALERLAADAPRLVDLRHESIIPVIEGRWLDDGRFALVRARIRGSTLDQVMSAVGPMPAERTADTLRQVNTALEYARSNGITQRDVTADGLVFQQGTGRAMMAFDPVLGGAAASDACMDARTIGRLATEMLTGQRAGAPGAKPLALARPDLAPELVQRTNALANCTGAVAPDIPAYIALLDPATRTVPAVVPAAASNDAVVVVNRGAGYGARFATAVLVLVALVALGVFWFHNRQENANRISVTETAPSTPVDTGTLSAGDVGTQTPANPLPPGYPMIVGSATPTPAPTAPTYPQPMPVYPAQPAPATPMPMTQPAPIQPTQPAATAPVTPTPAPVMKVDTAPSTSVRDTTVAASTDVCSSPSAADQRTCFSNAVAKSDAELTRVYNSVIASLRKQAGALPTDPDPASVSKLRTDEWSWLDQRDAACRGAGSPPLYAQARAQCYEQQTASRIDALKQMSSNPPSDSTVTP